MREKVELTTGWIVITIGVLAPLLAVVFDTHVALPAIIVGTSLPIMIASGLLAMAFIQSKRMRLPFHIQEWPKYRGDLPRFLRELLYVAAAAAVLLLLSGLLLLAADRWLETASPTKLAKVLAGVAVIGLLWGLRSRRKGAVRRKAVALLSSGPDGIAEWNRWRWSKRDLRHLHDSALTPEPDLRRVNLENRNLGNADLSYLTLEYADLSNCDLSSANLTRTRLNHCSLRNARLPQPLPPGLRLRHADLHGTDLRGASDPILFGAELEYANLAGLNLAGACLREGRLRGANFSEANLERADLPSTDLSEADLSGAKLAGADLRGAALWRANLAGADLSNCDLQHANLIEANLEGAQLSGSRVYGVSVWNSRLVGATQVGLVASRADEPTITVDDIEVAQLVYTLLTNDHVRQLLSIVSSRGVLLLGRFTGGGLAVLKALATRLRNDKYLPMIFDFDRPAQRNYTETVKTLVGLSRFVIVDLSGPSARQELYATVPHFKIPFVPILQEGKSTASMVVDILEYPWVVQPPIRFATVDGLINDVGPKIIERAERMVTEREAVLNEMIPRR